MSEKKLIRCVIVDDEPLAVQLLSEYVVKTPELELAASFFNPLEALKWLQSNPADLLFLDVQMDELTGVQLMKILGGNVNVILVTAYPEYAVDGFEYNALDYLLKPVSFDRFLVAIRKYHAVHQKTPPVNSPRNDEESHLFVKTEYKILRIPFDDILYLQGLRDYVAIITKEKKILTLQSLRFFEETLPSDVFVRIHRSYIISMKQINYVERNRVYIGKEPLPISDTYREYFSKTIRR